MGTMTAQVLIGSSHPNDGGIIPEWMMQVTENSRPYFLLHNNSSITGRPSMPFKRFGWIPSRDHEIEDMLGMIALHVIKYPPLVDAISWYCPRMMNKHVEAYNAPQEILDILHFGIRDIKEWPKLAISSFDGCYLDDFFERLDSYPIDYEICKTIKRKKCRSWGVVYD